MYPRWAPGIGDPSPVGWITVVAYLLAVLACFDAARRSRRRIMAGTRPYSFWMGLSLVLLFLGINKQLDLQALFMQVMRDHARAHGWYAERRHLQAVFIVTIIAIGGSTVAAIPWLFRTQDRSQHIALCGTIFLYAFIVVRAASFHHVDLALSHSYFMLKLNWIIELGGIATVLWGALVARNDRPRSARTPAEKSGNSIV